MTVLKHLWLTAGRRTPPVFRKYHSIQFNLTQIGRSVVPHCCAILHSYTTDDSEDRFRRLGANWGEEFEESPRRTRNELYGRFGSGHVEGEYQYGYSTQNERPVEDLPVYTSKEIAEFQELLQMRKFVEILQLYRVRRSKPHVTVLNCVLQACLALDRDYFASKAFNDFLREGDRRELDTNTGNLFITMLANGAEARADRYPYWTGSRACVLVEYQSLLDDPSERHAMCRFSGQEMLTQCYPDTETIPDSSVVGTVLNVQTVGTLEKPIHDSLQGELMSFELDEFLKHNQDAVFVPNSETVGELVRLAYAFCHFNPGRTLEDLHQILNDIRLLVPQALVETGKICTYMIRLGAAAEDKGIVMKYLETAQRKGVQLPPETFQDVLMMSDRKSDDGLALTCVTGLLQRSLFPDEGTVTRILNLAAKHSNIQLAMGTITLLGVSGRELSRPMQDSIIETYLGVGDFDSAIYELDILEKSHEEEMPLHLYSDMIHKIDPKLAPKFFEAVGNIAHRRLTRCYVAFNMTVALEAWADPKKGRQIVKEGGNKNLNISADGDTLAGYLMGYVHSQVPKPTSEDLNFGLLPSSFYDKDLNRLKTEVLTHVHELNQVIETLSREAVRGSDENANTDKLLSRSVSSMAIGSAATNRIDVGSYDHIFLALGMLSDEAERENLPFYRDFVLIMDAVEKAVGVDHNHLVHSFRNFVKSTGLRMHTSSVLSNESKFS